MGVFVWEKSLTDAAMLAPGGSVEFGEDLVGVLESRLKRRPDARKPANWRVGSG